MGYAERMTEWHPWWTLQGTQQEQSDESKKKEA